MRISNIRVVNHFAKPWDRCTEYEIEFRATINDYDQTRDVKKLCHKVLSIAMVDHRRSEGFPVFGGHGNEQTQGGYERG